MIKNEYNKNIIANKLKSDFKNEESNELNFSNLVDRYAIKTGKNACIIDTYRDELYCMSFTDFTKSYSNLKQEFYHRRGVETEYASKTFLESDDTKRFSDVVFNPKGDHLENEFNMFTGFYYPNKGQKIEDNKVSIIINLLDTLTNDRFGTEYILNWTSHSLQKPWERPETNIFFLGNQGTGKSIFCEYLLSKLFKKYHKTLSDSSVFEGSWNDELIGKLMIYLDEAVYSGDKKVANRVKNFTTGKTLNVKKKFFDSFEMNNYARIIGSSNNVNIAAVEKLDRRNVIFRTSDENIGNREYFNNVIKFIDENIDLIFNYFMNRDISNFNTRDIPYTEVKDEVRKENLEVHEEFLIELVDKLSDKEIETYLDKEKIIKNDNLLYVEKHYLYQQYLTFAKVVRPSKYKHETKNKFTSIFEECFGREVSVSKRLSDGEVHRCFVFNYDSIKDKVMNHLKINNI